MNVKERKTVVEGFGNMASLGSLTCSDNAQYTGLPIFASIENATAVAQFEPTSSWSAAKHHSHFTTASEKVGTEDKLKVALKGYSVVKLVN